MKCFSIILFILLSDNLFAQFEFICELDSSNISQTSSSRTTGVCEGNSSDFINYYDLPENHIPNQNIPVKTIQLNFIIIQKDNGSGNFQENVSGHTSYLSSLVGTLNSIYGNISPKPNQVECIEQYINDSRIQFSLENIYYKKDSYGWNCNYTSSGTNCTNFSKCPENTTTGYDDHYLIDQHAVDLQNSINVFFIEDECLYNTFGLYQGTLPDCQNDFVAYQEAYDNIVNQSLCNQKELAFQGCSWFPTFEIPSNAASTIIMRNAFTGYLFNNIKGNCPLAWGYSSGGRLLAHELGHSLGLSHDNSCTNLMSRNPGGWHIKPSQLGIMHRSLALTSVRKYVKNCPALSPAITIANNEIWDFDMKVYGNIIVNAGATLTLTCNVVLSEDAKILVKGTLKLEDGVEIESACCKAKIQVIDDGEVIVGNNTELYLHKGLGLDIDDNGKVEILNSSSICIDEDVEIFIEDPTASLIIHNVNYNEMVNYEYDLNLPALVLSGDYKAINSITNQGNLDIYALNSVRFISGREIVLRPETYIRVTPEASWHAYIDKEYNNCFPSDICNVGSGKQSDSHTDNLINNNRMTPLDESFISIKAKKDNQIYCYPNPFTDKISISITLKQQQNVSIKIFDITGRELLEVMNWKNKPKGDYRFDFDTKNLAAGAYFLVFQTNTDLATKKIVKVR